MPNSVTLPGGQKCPGGLCKKADTVIRKFSTKKRYNIPSVKGKPMPEKTKVFRQKDTLGGNPSL